MLRKISLVALALTLSFAFDLDQSEAGRRRGGFFQRMRANRTSYRTTNNATRYNRAPKLHQTHSSSAILDGFFGPFPGGSGHDASWYVGK
ncbi:MAG: hypothetical protein AAGD11_14285 [Planctomycetota bacterium]